MAQYTIHYWDTKTKMTRCGMDWRKLTQEKQTTTDWGRVNCPECQMLRYPAKSTIPPRRVVIHVKGGMAYYNRLPKGVEVRIIDHDRR